MPSVIKVCKCLSLSFFLFLFYFFFLPLSLFFSRVLVSTKGLSERRKKMRKEVSERQSQSPEGSTGRPLVAGDWSGAS